MSKRLDMLEQMIAKGSEDPFVHYARAMELRSLERKDEALVAYGEVMGRFPDYVPTYLMAAQLAHELGRDDEALAHCDAGLAKARAAGDGQHLHPGAQRRCAHHARPAVRPPGRPGLLGLPPHHRSHGAGLRELRRSGNLA